MHGFAIEVFNGILLSSHRNRSRDEIGGDKVKCRERSHALNFACCHPLALHIRSFKMAKVCDTAGQMDIEGKSNRLVERSVSIYEGLLTAH